MTRRTLRRPDNSLPQSEQENDMNKKIPVLLTQQQIEFIMTVAHSKEKEARKLDRPEAARFFFDLWESLDDAEQDAATEREVELNYERGAA
jgi:hypothetical protein